MNSLAIGGGDKVSVVEREVSLTLDPWHIGVKTNAIESVTDLNWDKEIAQPNSQIKKLVIDPQHSNTCHYLDVCPFVPVLEIDRSKQKPCLLCTWSSLSKQSTC